jgi:hypothetical protein
MAISASKADALRIESGGSAVKTLQSIRTVPGVDIMHVGGIHKPGLGMIRVSTDGNFLQYKAPGSSSWGVYAPIPADGDYLVLDGDDRNYFVRVTVHADYIIEQSESPVIIKDVYENELGYDDITNSEASSGHVDSYNVTLKNEGTWTITQLYAWINEAVSYMEISDNGISYVSPTGSAKAKPSSALSLANISPGDSITFHLKRTIPASTSYDPKVRTIIHWSFMGSP